MPGRVEGQRRDRAERPEEGDLLVLVGHPAPLRAEHEQAGEVAVGLQRVGHLAPQRDHRVGRPGRTRSQSDIACGTRIVGT